MYGKWRRCLKPVMLAIALGGIVGVLYGYVLHLPFFWDDPPIMLWATTHSWRDILLSTENGYYRPVTMVIYKLGVEFLPLGNGFRATVMHVLSPALVWFSALIISRICAGSGTLAALLFLTYPLLNEVVAWITALGHPLTIFFTLLALYSFQCAGRGQRYMGWLGVFALVLAPLSHESGVASAWLVAGYLLIQNFGKRGLGGRPVLFQMAVALVLSLAVVLSRPLLPGVLSPFRFRGLRQLGANWFYFLQTFLYPLGPAIGYAVQRWHWHDFTLLTLATGGVVAWALAVRRSCARPMLAALWWWAVAAVPAAFSLSYNALFVGARLGAFSAVGAILFWAALIEATALRVGQLWGRWLTRVALVVGVVIPALSYHHRIVTLYRLLDTIYDQVIKVARACPDRPLTFVNVPSALIWNRRTFPLSTDNVVGVPDTPSGLQDFLTVNLGPRDVRAVTYRSIYQMTDPFWLSLGPWVEGPALREAVWERETFLGRYDEVDRRFVLLHAGTMSRADGGSRDPLAMFDVGTRLVSASLERLGEGAYRLTLVWEAAGRHEGTILVHVVDSGGRILAQADGDALSGLISPRMWRAGERIVDRRTFRLPDCYRGEFAVRVGFYNSRGRLPAWVGGARAPDDAPFVVRATAP